MSSNMKALQPREANVLNSTLKDRLAVPKDAASVEPQRTTRGMPLQDKAATVFQEMDERGQHAISREQFLLLFRTLQLPLDAKEVNDIFLDGDRDEDGWLSWKDFADLMTQQYATLLDILYVRLCDVKEIHQTRFMLEQALYLRETRTKEIEHTEKTMAELEAEMHKTADDLQRCDEGRGAVESAINEHRKRVCSAEIRLEAGSQKAQAKALDSEVAEEIVSVRAKERDEWEVRASQWNSEIETLSEEVKESQAEEERLIKLLERAREQTRAKMQLLADAQTICAECQGGLDDVSSLLQDAESAAEAQRQSLEGAKTERSELEAVLESARKDLENAARRQQQESERYEHLKAKIVELERRQESSKIALEDLVADVAVQEEKSVEHKRVLEALERRREDREVREAPLVRDQVALREEKKLLCLKELSLRGSAMSMYGNESSRA